MNFQSLKVFTFDYHYHRILHKIFRENQTIRFRLIAKNKISGRLGKLLCWNVTRRGTACLQTLLWRPVV